MHPTNYKNYQNKNIVNEILNKMSDKASEIVLKVELDEKQLPHKISWRADGHPDHQDFQEAKGMLLSLFDKETKDTLKIDLWTTQMQMIEMDRFIFQSLKGLTNTYARATNNKELSQAMHQFTQFFGEETEILERKDDDSNTSGDT